MKINNFYLNSLSEANIKDFIIENSRKNIVQNQFQHLQKILLNGLKIIKIQLKKLINHRLIIN